jgi:hypothetical protein
VLSRIWVITSLIVAFVAASWTFGLRPGSADGSFGGFADRPATTAFLDDEGRDR